LERRRGLSQTHLIFIGMLAGLIIGFAFPGLGTKLEPLSTIFIRLVKTIIVPIHIRRHWSLGIAGHADPEGRRAGWASRRSSISRS